MTSQTINNMTEAEAKGFAAQIEDAGLFTASGIDWPRFGGIVVVAHTSDIDYEVLRTREECRAYLATLNAARVAEIERTATR